ncbi:hypothetical protein AB0N88_36435 [Streptomyces sp. NPDC093516]|uniref:hypothetical protein n=1 Tax=Streptomyces sp. NPDC093516 TaxID=3155304 RepID=UPI003422AD74
MEFDNRHQARAHQPCQCQGALVRLVTARGVELVVQMCFGKPAQFRALTDNLGRVQMGAGAGGNRVWQ